MWFIFLTDVLTAKEANMQKYTKYTVYDVCRYDFFWCFIFEVPVEKVVIDEEKLHGIEIDAILNLEILLEQWSSIKNVGIWK